MRWLALLVLLAACGAVGVEEGPVSLAEEAAAEGEAAAPDAQVAEAPAEAPRGGLFGLFRRTGIAASADQGAALGAQASDALAPGFGEVRVACGVSGGALGREVDRYPREGRAVWRLYDTDPTSTAPRLQYVTGFSDGCPRAVSAVLGLFGATDVHEAKRYDPDNKVAWAESDLAYEALKQRACGVGRGTPCPDARRAALERGTGFVTFYPSFGTDAGRWFTLLLSGGKLVAASVKEG